MRTDRESRLRRAGGKSYLDLLRRREGDASDAPDAVVTARARPRRPPALLAAVRRARRRRRPVRRRHERGRRPGRGGPRRPAVRSPSTCGRMASVQALDVPSSLVTVGPGMRGPALEEALGREGLTFGHLPQSWEFATLGGYAATRSAGQNSTGVGRFDELVAGLTLATPSGVLELGHPPASAAGPRPARPGAGLGGHARRDHRAAAAGAARSRRPARYEGWSFRTWAGRARRRCSGWRGTTCCPTSSGCPTPTRRAPTCSWPPAPAPGRCAARSAPAATATGCLLVRRLGGPARRWCGPAHAAAASLLREGGGIRLGRRVGESWRKHRFQAPYLRDSLLDAGLLVETLETAATWSALPTVYDAVRRALRESLGRDGRRPLVMSHVSHGYPTGASLYVTVLADRDDDLPHPAVAGRQAGGDRRAAGRRRHADPPPRRRRRPPPLAGAGGRRRWASRCCARSRSGWTPRASATPASCSPTERPPLPPMIR